MSKAKVKIEIELDILHDSQSREQNEATVDGIVLDIKTRLNNAQHYLSWTNAFNIDHIAVNHKVIM